MIIRQEQIQAMQNAMALDYQRRLAAYFRDRAPEIVKRFDETSLKQRMGSAISKAREFGINSDEGILQFVGLSLIAGPSFDLDPAVRKFFNLSGSSPDLKIKRLVELVHKNLNRKRNGDG